MRGSGDLIQLPLRGTFLLLAHPVLDGHLYGVFASPVTLRGEIHFVLQGTDPDEPPVLAGHEAATCLQVLKSFHGMVEGRNMEDIHFYAYYDGAWQHIVFVEWHPERQEKSWPDCDSGAALGDPIIERVDSESLVRGPAKDDFDEHPLIYWCHSNDAIKKAIRTHEDELDSHARSVEVQVPFGAISYGATEIRSRVGLFAKRKDVLRMRMRALELGSKVIYMTPIVAANARTGWAVVAVVFKELRNNVQVFEPGTHSVPTWKLESLRDDFARHGVNAEILSETSWRVELATEVDLSDYDSSGDMVFRRGAYTFEFTGEPERIRIVPCVP